MTREAAGPCYFCERTMILPRPFWNGTEPLTVTRDHFIPRSRGGSGGANIVLACRDCNELKGDLTGEEFEEATDLFWEMGFKLERVLTHYKPLRNHQVWPRIAELMKSLQRSAA